VRNPIIAKFLVSRKGAKDKRKGAEDFAGKERRRLMNALPTFRLISISCLYGQKISRKDAKGKRKDAKSFAGKKRRGLHESFLTDLPANSSSCLYVFVAKKTKGSSEISGEPLIL
jgi:hypothetical protein